MVKDQDKAKEFFCNKLGFIVWTDELYGQGMRWLVVSPQKINECMISLVKADTPEKLAAVGKQVPGNVLLVFETDNIEKSYKELVDKGISFHGKIQDVPWGKEIVFEDLYGNLFDLIEPSKV